MKHGMINGREPLDAVARLAAEVRVVAEDGLERLVRGVALGRREALVDWRGLHQAQCSRAAAKTARTDGFPLL